MNSSGLEIAIIGMAGRFPGASSLAEFWQNLRQGVESIQSFSEAELQAQGVESALLQHPQYVKAGAALAGIDQFDAEFFGFNPKEAEILDPQHRLFLESAWEALEDAGYDAEQYSGAVGVYASAAMNSYLLNLVSHPDLQTQFGRYQLFLASDKDFLTTRVSYKLNLTGPSIDIQTACSSSLVAVHIACQSLLGGECEMALAGGVALSEQTGYLYQTGGIYSPDGHCRAFDAQAAGTVAGSGLGIVVLKRLEDALQAGDDIRAVIKGSAVNNDGAQKVSYTAPSITAQAQVIRAAQQVAETPPERISYIETHGTGTPLGDPIEIAALTEAFQNLDLPPQLNSPKTCAPKTCAPKTCAIGSLKPNIGHLDTAAGIASLIKTVLALQHRQIPPSLHFQQPNPQINFEQSPFYVNAQLCDWQNPTPELPLRAGVSSFGIGGTNVHLVLEAAPTPTPASPARPWQILTLSAKTPAALDQVSQRLLTHLRQHPDLNLADVAYTLQLGRRGFSCRRALLCQTVEDAIQTLESPESPESNRLPRLFGQVVPTSSASVAFLFPGQGSQFPNMGRDLYDQEPRFKATLDQCCDLLLPHLGFDLRDLLYPAHAAAPLDQTHLAQPALFVVEYTLAQLWISWGVQPAAMIGHSIGEYVAATIAGVFSLETALRLVALRGQLMQACPAGAMLSVSLSATQTATQIEAAIQPGVGELALAAENAPELCVVSGSLAAVSALQDQLAAQSIPCRQLHVSHAFHSEMMQSVLPPFREALRRIELKPPRIPVISNITGTWLTATAATDPEYWLSQLRQPVRFSAGIASLQQPNLIWLEVGAGQTLSQLVKAQLKSSEQSNLLSSLCPPQSSRSISSSFLSGCSSDSQLMLHSLSKLWLSGLSVNWAQFYANESRQRLPLPTYPFQRQRYWVELPSRSELPSQSSLMPPSADLEPDLEPDSSQPKLYLPTWERSLPLGFNAEHLSEPHCWLICLDAAGVAATLAQRLADAGQDVFTVAIGDQFSQLGYRAFALNPDQPSDYRTLQQDLQQRDLLPDRILYGWGLDLSTPAPLLYLTQRFAPTSAAIQLSILTIAAQDVTGEEVITPAPTAILGLAQVIEQEYPQCICRQIDVGSQAAPLTESLTESLLMELVEPMLADRVIAYRGQHRWRQQFQAIAPQRRPDLWRDHGHYVIVGDCSQGLGQHWARALAALQLHLTLIGDWQNSAAAELFGQSLEAMGASCFIQTAELGSRDQVQAAIAASEAKFGEIHGIFYSTPMSNEQSMGLLSDLNETLWPQKWDYCCRTKVSGLHVLEQVLQDRRLDFCLLQSSLSSLVGGLGLGAYAAANRVMDACIQSKRNRSWLSVNWDACSLEPSLEPSSAANGFGAGLAAVALTAEQVWLATELALSSGYSGQLIVCKTDLQSRIQQAFSPAPSRSTDAYPRSQLSSDYAPPRNSIEQTIVQQWQQLLGIEPVGIYDSFFELGGHSLLAIQAIAQLRQAFQVELPISSLLIEAPTIAEIAALIAEPQPSLTALATILNEVQALSPEDIRQELSS